MDRENDSPSGPSNTGHNNHISAPHITVSIGGGGVKAIIGALVAVAILLLLTVPVAKGADQKADFTAQNMRDFEVRTNARLDKSDTEVRLLSYWAERAETAAVAAGVKMPPLPFEKKPDHK